MQLILQKLGVLAAMLPAFLAVSAFNPGDVEINGIYYRLDGSFRDASVTDCRRRDSLVIPSTVAYERYAYTVTSISKYAIMCSDLTSITLPNSMKWIAGYAFHDCPLLTSITIPNSVTSISGGAFDGCSSLTSLEFNATNCTSCGSSDNPAFPSTIATVTIGKEVTRIPNSFLTGCNGLTSITIPNSVTTIGDYAFRGCSSLTSITIPNSVTTIGGSAFENCSSLTSLEFNATNCTSCGSSDKPAFPSTVATLTVGEDVTTIPTYLFASGGERIQAIWLGNTPPEGASQIKAKRHYVSTDKFPFSNQKVYPFLSSRFEVNNITYVPVSPSERTCDVICCNYASPSGEKVVDSTVRSNRGVRMTVLDINDYAFYNNDSITGLKISNKGSIGEEAFYGCDALTSIDVSNQGDILLLAFSGCTNLETAVVNNVGSIGANAFYECSALKSLTIGANVTTIGDDAFSDCTALTSFTSLAVTPPECGADVFYGIDKQKCTLYVPAGCKEAYMQAPQWKDFFFIEEMEAVLVSEIRLNEMEVNMTEGEMFQLTTEVLPTNATNKALLWESSDANCVTVNENGLLTAIAQGTATITVRSADGNAEATCAVTVLSQSGIESVSTDCTAEVEVFNLTGVKVADSTEGLPAGLYLVRRGSAVRKVTVK